MQHLRALLLSHTCHARGKTGNACCCSDRSVFQGTQNDSQIIASAGLLVGVEYFVRIYHDGIFLAVPDHQTIHSIIRVLTCLPEASKSVKAKTSTSLTL